MTNSNDVTSLVHDVHPCCLILIDESIKGAASLNRYGITFDDNIDMVYNFRWLSIYDVYPYLKNGREVTISKMSKTSLLTKKICSTKRCFCSSVINEKFFLAESE